MRKVIFLALAVLMAAVPAFPQASYGRLEGVVKDAQGLVLPGVTITMSSESVMGERVTTSDIDGSYRYLALPPGTYSVLFELTGFGSINREGVVVTTGSTFTIDVSLDIATVAETITVTGESPVVDVKSTGVNATFDKQQLDEVPSATDMWAVLQQSPGVRMRGYDVGGSHKSQQSGYETFGIRDQNRIVNDGVNTTEGTGGAGGYYDYYSIEEFQVSAQGADVEMSTPGALVVATTKSGGNALSSLTHFDFEDGGMITDNIDDELIGRGGSSAPVRTFREFHIDVGGPLIRDKFWFFGAYNYFKIDRVISGQPADVATDIGLFDMVTGKVTYQVSEQDQFIGYSQWSLKQKPFRGLSANIPAESIRAQDSWTWLHKAEWQRVWNDRLFTNVLVGHFGFGWPMVPAVDPNTNPARLDTGTSQERGSGWQPFTFNRYKPQSTGQINYYLPSAAGSHDFKFGWDWQVDSRQFGWNTNSGAIRYRDNSNNGPCVNCAVGQLGAVDEIEFFNVPTGNDDRNMHTDIFAQDIWTVSDRLTLSFGARFGRQRIYFLDGGSLGTPLLTEFFQENIAGADDLISFNNIAPRVGFTYDVSGSGKTVLKGYYGRYYSNAGTGIPDSNPGGQASERYQFLDQNANGVFDGRQELGALTSSSGGAGNAAPPVPGDTELAYTDEFSFSFEHELVADTSVRFSYVRKQTRNNFETDALDSFNLARSTDNLTNAVSVPCTGCPTGFEGTTLNLRGLPDGVPTINNITGNAPGITDGNYDTIQFAFNRRFRGNWFVNGNFDYQWRAEMRSPSDESTSPLTTDPLDVEWDPAYNRDVAVVQDSTNWGAKGSVRYVAPHEVGIASSVRLQSGYQWAPIHRAALPNVGTVPFFLENIENNRSDSVAIIDLRIDKSFTLGDRYQLTGMFDIYNVFNSNPETNFTLRTGSNFNNIIEWLQGRTFKVGLRFQF